MAEIKTPINNRVTYSLNQIHNIANGGQKIYHFIISSRIPFELTDAYMSQNGLRGEVDWLIHIANLKIDGILVEAAHDYELISNFYEVIESKYPNLEYSPLKALASIEFDIRVYNNALAARDSNTTFWYAISSYDNTVISFDYSVT